ncbi:MAG TPA: hypothetical protein DCP53_07720 [Elusimicrobia bacterium]|nr:hypothetical protein [Elusimicrobiota bacterium]
MKKIRSEAESRSMGNKKILVIEDQKSIVELLKLNLTINGYDVIIARDGEEGVKKVFDKYPDLIILDIKLPKSDGFQVCQQLKNNIQTKHIPIIFLSAFTQKTIVEKGKEVGGDFFVQKPFDAIELIKIIKKLL